MEDKLNLGDTVLLDCSQVYVNLYIVSMLICKQGSEIVFNV